MQASLRSRKLALFVFFFIPGLALASWVTRTPDIRDSIEATIAQMGLVLSGLSVGSMSGVLLSGQFIRRRGTRFTMLLGLSLVCLSMLTMAWGVMAGSQLLTALGLCFFGFGTGMAEIAINMDAALVEQESGEHVMHVLHGCFSLGTLVGALLGLGANAWHIPVAVHLGTVFVVTTLLLSLFCKRVPSGYGMQASSNQTSQAEAPKQRSVWLDPRVQMIGFVVFAMALTEGSAYDWLPILLVDEHGFSAALGSMIFVAFAAMMTVGRFGGSILLKRFGRMVVVRMSIALATLGVAFISLGHGQFLAGMAVMCWGLGAALGFPVALSAAAEGGAQQMNERVKAVATIGYFALLVGPPALGFVGQTFGLRGAMLAVLCFVMIAMFMSHAMRSPKVVITTPGP